LGTRGRRFKSSHPDFNALHRAGLFRLLGPRPPTLSCALVRLKSIDLSGVFCITCRAEPFQGPKSPRADCCMRKYFFVLLAILCIGQLALSLIQRSYDRGALLLPVSTSNSPVSVEGENSRLATTAADVARRVSASSSEASSDNKDVHRAAPDNSVRRDPFAPFFAVKGPDTLPSSLTLTDVELKEVRVTAILRTASGKASASVETAAGRSFVIAQGSPIGTNGGRVTEISPTSIVVSEPAPKDSIADSESELITILHLREQQK
jgi:hypothetical protein